MTVHEMPSQSPYQKLFRIFASLVIALFSGILYVSIWTPVVMTDQTRTVLGWAAGGLLVAAVLIGMRLGLKQSVWNLRRGYRVELSAGKIIQSWPGTPKVELLTDHIASIQQGRGGTLVIRGGEPRTVIAVPSEIVGFENLKAQLLADRTLPSLKVKLSPWLFLPSPSYTAALLIFFLAHGRRVVIAAGAAVLLFHALWTYSFIRFAPSNRRAKAVFFANCLAFMILAWIVYERATFHF
jgi:hypothetical protein